ncbi:hypothetical protein TNCV_2755851 [Trichonephila clavipes]|nr:hypothetical protein TNCV_2755851 [Trichonephila clavipes]
MADLLPRNRVLPNTTSQRGDTSQVLSSMRSPSSCLRCNYWAYGSRSESPSHIRVSAADKGRRVYPLDPRSDAVALYSGCTPGKRRA